MNITRTESLKKRHLRVRRKVSGTADRPRLVVNKSLKHIYAQIVDDTTGHSLCQASTTSKAERAGGAKSFANKTMAKKIGETIAAKAKEKGITQVVFDRGGYRYHGAVKELADAVRAAGINL